MILACPVRGKQKSVDLCNAFVQGAPKSARGFVFYGVNETNKADWLTAQKSGHPWFYIDGSYFDCVRGQQFRITKNRIQVNAAARISDGKRFAKLGVEVKPWRTGKHVVLVQQSDSFMRDIARDPNWFERIERDFAASGLRVKVRLWGSDKIKGGATLLDDLKDASSLACHSSAAAVTAVCEGVPVVGLDSMSALDGMQVSVYPARDQRLQFLSVLADNQWSLKSIKSGEPWAWLAKN